MGECLWCGGEQDEQGACPTHGVLECPVRCGDCSGHHHFAEGGITTEEAWKEEHEAPHPAMILGHTAWWECYHCTCWLPYDADSETGIPTTFRPMPGLAEEDD